MNIFDYNLFIASLITLSAYAYYVFKRKDFKFSIFTVIIIAPVLFLSIDKTTSFLTVDETYMISETIDLKNSDMGQWNMGAFRTTDVLIGPVFSILSYFIDFSNNYNIAKMLAKALHWYLGFILILFIHFLMDKHFLTKENRESGFILFLYIFMLLPTNNLAMSIFNYDLFSMQFAVITVICLCVSVKNQDQKAAMLALVTAVFAAQEKLSAAPLIPISMLSYTWYSYRHSDAFHSPRFVQRCPRLILYAAISLALMMGICALSFLIAGAARGSFSSLKGFTYPLVTWTWPLVGRFARDPVFGVFVLIAEFIGAVIGAELIKQTEALLRREGPLQVIRDYLQKQGYILVLTLLIMGLAAGITKNICFPEHFIGPLTPVAPGNYQPPAFNKVFAHFNAPDSFSHTAMYTLKCYATFFNALPTALTLLMIFSLLSLRKQCDPLWFIIGFGILIAPLFYGLTLTPASMRYQNIPLALFPVLLLYLFDKILINRKFRQIVVAIAIIAVFLEVFPFRPLYASFRPIWLNHPEEFNRIPSIGKNRSGAWGGWGEEVMMAGKKIEELCLQEKIACEDIRLYYLYPGQWLDAEIPIKLFSVVFYESRLTKNDYYVINRAGVIYGGVKYVDFEVARAGKYDRASGLNFEVVPPEFTISFRGYTQAWIFRGDQLRPKTE
ncbi:hypothetical protein QUF80_08910 [Desulfococcaceae bacterium HSG8]|nr:hypothetical protein [Desulfococcaceae bacterium HSG8]